MQNSIIQSELVYKAIRSSGAGGQHVNKVSSKVVLYFNLEASQGLSEDEKERLKNFLSSRLTNDFVLQLSVDSYRSQLRNKKEVTQRFFDLLEEGLKADKPRKKSKPSRSAILKAKQAKKKLSEKKKNRQKPSPD